MAMGCQCDSRYDGCEHPPWKCHKKAGTAWSRYFCSECDPRRRAHIMGNLQEIRDSLRNR